MVCRLSAKAKEQGSRFYQASITTAASTAEGIKRLAQGEPLQVCSHCSVAACNTTVHQLVVAAANACRAVVLVGLAFLALKSKAQQHMPLTS